MIVQATRIRATSQSRDAVLDHVFEGKANEASLTIQGSRADVEDMVADAKAAGKRYGFRHFKVSALEATTREEAMQIVRDLAAEFGFDADQCTVQEHSKKRALGPKGRAHGRHWHILAPEFDPVSGKVLDSSWMRPRQEKVARAAEIRLGHQVVRGRWGASVERALRAEGRPDLAAQVAPTTRSDRPKSAFTASQHQRAERQGLSQAQARAAAAVAWASADSDPARLAALHDAGIEVQPGAKASVWVAVDRSTGTELGALDRLLREARAETGLSAEDWRRHVDGALTRAIGRPVEAAEPPARRRSKADAARAQRVLGRADPARLAALTAVAMATADAAQASHVTLAATLAADGPTSVDESATRSRVDIRRAGMAWAERSLGQADPGRLASLVAQAEMTGAAAAAVLVTSPAVPAPPQEIARPARSRAGMARAERSLGRADPGRLASLVAQAETTGAAAAAALATSPAMPIPAQEVTRPARSRAGTARAERSLGRADADCLVRLMAQAETTAVAAATALATPSTENIPAAAAADQEIHDDREPSGPRGLQLPRRGGEHAPIITSSARGGFGNPASDRAGGGATAGSVGGGRTGGHGESDRHDAAAAGGDAGYPEAAGGRAAAVEDGDGFNLGEAARFGIELSRHQRRSSFQRLLDAARDLRRLAERYIRSPLAPHQDRSLAPPLAAHPLQAPAEPACPVPPVAPSPTADQVRAPTEGEMASRATPAARRSAPAADPRAARLLGQAKAEELARRQLGSSTRRIPVIPDAAASAAERAAWVEKVQALGREARRRASAQAVVPLADRGAAQAALLKEQKSQVRDAISSRDAINQDWLEHRAEKPSFLARWRDRRAWEQWQRGDVALAERAEEARRVEQEARTALEAEAHRLRTSAGLRELDALIRRSGLEAELAQLRRRDAAAEVEEIERRLRIVWQQWSDEPTTLAQSARAKLR